MNRELRFRAWDKKYNVMLCTGFNIIGEVTLFNGVEAMLDEQSKKHNDDTPSLIRLNDLEITQFTGLKDKHEVDIYEGDIVKAKGWSPQTMRIEFIEGGFCATNPNLSIPTDINQFYDSTGCMIEVIGNVFENPDLLTQQ